MNAARSAQSHLERAHRLRQHLRAVRFVGAGTRLLLAGYSQSPDGARGRRRVDRGPASSIRCTSPRAKRVICLYMAGGPSHLETFDYKPKLAEMHGQPMPESFTKGQPIAQLQGAKADLLRRRSIRSSIAANRGRRSRASFPHLGRVADDMCIIRSLHTEPSITTRPTRS